MLTQVTSSSTTVTSSAKQIAVNIQTSGTLYTVPAGKTFTGFVNSSSSNVAIYVNGAPVYCGGSSYYSFVPTPLTLVAGTVVTGQSSYGGSLIGIEQ